MDDEEEPVVTVQSDADGEENEELVFTDPTGLSEDDIGLTDTRSEEDNSGVELSGAEQGTNGSSEAVESGSQALSKQQLLRAIRESMDDIKPKENIDEVERDQLREAIRASLEERGQVPDTPPSTPELMMGNRQEALNERSRPLGAIPKKATKTGARHPVSPKQEVDPGLTLGANEPDFASPMDCVLRLAICAQRMERHQQKEAMAVIRYLLMLEESADGALEQGPREDDGAGEDRRPRPEERDQPRRKETQGRPCPKLANPDEIPLDRKGSRSNKPSDGARKSKNLGKDGGKPWRNSQSDSKAKRFQRPKDRREEQARSLPSRCTHGTCGGTRARENSGSLLPEKPESDPESMTEEERRAFEQWLAAEPVYKRELRSSPAIRPPTCGPCTTFRHGPIPSQPGGRRRGQRRRHARGSQGGNRPELRRTSVVLPDKRDKAAESCPAKQTGLNRNRQGGQDGAQGRGKRTGGHGGQRPKFKGLDDRPPPVNPYEWSEETRRAFKVHMENWAQEEDPRIRDQEMESEPSDWSQVTEDEYPDEAVRKIGVPTNNNVHVTGLMQNPGTREITKLKMVIDQGQTVKQGILISEELMKKLNLPYERLLQGKKVGTAKGSAALEKVGITKPFNIKIPGISKTFSSKAVVCKDVADECNLGTAFLQSIHRATGLKPRLEFSHDGTRLVLGEDQVELVRRLSPQKQVVQPAEKHGDNGLGPEDPTQGDRGRQARRQTAPTEKRRSASVGARKKRIMPIFLKKDTLVKGNSLNFVEVDRIPASALLEPVKAMGLGSVRAVPGIYQDQKKIAVLNLEEDRVLRAGTQIAEVLPTKHLPREKTEEKVRSVKEPDGRAEELIKELKLDEKELLNADPALKEQVKELVREYSDIFSSPEVAFGKTSLIEFEIHLEPGSKPVKSKLRPINPKQRADLKEQLDKWKAEDVVEECESPWASALVPVLKKDGSTRWAVDYRPLNKMTIKDSYPLPSINENLEKLQGSQIFSTLDAAGAYHCVPVAEQARPMLAFVTPFGVHTFKRMPFGASNSGPCFARFMEMLISKLRSPWTLCYLDDLMVHTINTKQHVEELRKVFQMHREAGIKLKAKKTDLFEVQANYLGYKITQQGVCMREDYVEKILGWPAPRTVKELSSFLGVVGYYRTFIPKFASLTHEMNAQKKQKELQWNEDLQSKFEQLKKLFGEQPIRAYPDYEGEVFEVWPDFSSLAFGGVLQQVQDGKRRFIAASGRKTTAGERNYPPTKGELASIVHILRKHEHLLRYKKFKVYTDHQPLKWLRSMKNPKGIYWRWLNELESYDFEVVHVAGKKTGAADGLSRSSHLPEPTAEEEAEAEEFVFRTSEQGLPTTKLDRVALKDAQEQDEVLRTVKKWVKGDPPKSKEEIRGLPHDAHVYHQHLAVLDVDEGDLLVMKKTPGFNKEVQRILIPNQAKIRDEVYKFSHVHPSAGHFGTQATSARAALKFYWPGMNAELKRKVRNCDTCLAKIQQVNLKGGEHKPRKHGFPGEVLYIDLVGPMPETDKGDRYIATMQDGFSRYCAATTIPNKEASTVANALLDTWVTRFGCPVRIHSDQGKEFHNKIWHQLCDRLQITKTVTPAYNPNSNLIERFHRTLNTIMRTHLAREDAGWARFLPMATFAFNTKVNATTGMTPFEAWMGRPAKLPIDLVIPTPDTKWANADAYIQETLVRFQEMYAFMRKHTEATFQRNAKLYAGNANNFQVDDLVWVFSKRKVPGKPTKITDGWTGPYRVLSKPAEVLLEVTPAGVEGRAVTIHVARAALVRGEVREGRNPLLLQEPGEYEVDELAEDLCLPAQWVLPQDNLLVPVKTSPEPPMIRDLSKHKTPTHVVSAPSQTDGAGPSQVQSTDDNLEGNSKKRSLPTSVSDDELGPDRKGRFLRVQVQGEKRGHQGSKQVEPLKHRRRQAEKRDHQTDSDSNSTPGPKPKIRWRDLARDSESESGPSDREMRLQQEERMDSSSDEDVKALREDMENLGECVIIDIPPNIKPPDRGTAGSAGWDCRANQAVTIGPRQTRKVDIGLKMALPAGQCALLLSRSRLASEGITVEGGLIDSDYRGSILCILHNNTECSRRIQKGEKICQLLILSTPSVKWQTVQKLDETVRASGGFGHTGQF